MVKNKPFLAAQNPRPTSHPQLGRNELVAILTQLENGVIVTSPDGRVLLINQAACVALGVSEAYAGRHLREVFQHPELLEIFDERKSHPSHSEIILEDGRVFNAQSSLIPEIGLVIILQDITYLKELDRIKTDFVNTVSHDLRSPLTAILGYVELIARVGPINDQQRDFIHRVQFSVNNITALINDLLDLGRVEAGFDARKEIVHLLPIVQEVIEGLRPRIKEKEHTITLDIPLELPPVLGNPIRLRQMFTNLINNAVKYTPKQGHIDLRSRIEDGQIIFQICDNGPGILPADQPYVFDKFYRGSNVPHDSPGSGLGLAIVQSIVQNHLGRIWLDSTPGQGTTFTVVLPIPKNI